MFRLENPLALISLSIGRDSVDIFGFEADVERTANISYREWSYEYKIEPAIPTLVRVSPIGQGNILHEREARQKDRILLEFSIPGGVSDTLIGDVCLWFRRPNDDRTIQRFRISNLGERIALLKQQGLSNVSLLVTSENQPL
jgi:hypothetical protein